MACWNVIDETTLDSNEPSISFTNIPSSYDHLYLTVSARDTKSAYYNYLEFRFNGDSTPYSNTYLNASTATPTSTRHTSSEVGDVIGMMASDDALADTFSTTTMWIPNYANESNFKQCLIQSVVPNDSNSTNEWYLRLTAGLFARQDAIDQIRVKPYSSPQFQEYTSIVLYGIKGA
jgi:predicted carbohydrate-binding protein with CBM5 and CBM33 domain